MINPELGYSDETEALIQRMCRNVERKNFVLHKKKAEELILQTYDLFNLPRPKKMVWCVDIFNKKYQESAGSARSAVSAMSARSAVSAMSARSAGSARSAWSAMSAMSARSARSAVSAWSAWSTGSTGSVGSAGSALDYDFGWFIFEHEYCQNPTEGKPNKNDRIYLEYCELLMQAKEAGLGYRVEWEDTLYLVPTPLVLIDEQNRFHSTDKPAIRWRGGNKFYYLYGVNFDEKTWKKVTSPKVHIKTILSLKNIEQRMAAIKLVGAEKLLKTAKLVKKSKGYELYLIKDVFSTDAYYLKYACPSTGRVYVSGIDPTVGKKGDPIECAAWKWGVSKEEFLNLEIQT